MAVTVQMRGADEVLARLKSLRTAVAVKASRKALGKAAALVRKAAKANALRVDDSETGRRIADNIGQRVRTGYARRTGNQMVSVGVLTEKGRIPKGNPDAGPKGNTPHWHLIEEGTERTRAQPFLRPALADNVQPATDAFVRALNPEIDKAIKKMGA